MKKILALATIIAIIFIISTNKKNITISDYKSTDSIVIAANSSSEIYGVSIKKIPSREEVFYAEFPSKSSPYRIKENAPLIIKGAKKKITPGKAYIISISTTEGFLTGRFCLKLTSRKVKNLSNKDFVDDDNLLANVCD